MNFMNSAIISTGTNIIVDAIISVLLVSLKSLTSNFSISRGSEKCVSSTAIRSRSGFGE